MVRLRDEVHKLLQEALSDTALVMEMNFFGSRKVLEGHEIGDQEISQALVAWLKGATLGFLRIAEEVDKPRGLSPSVSSG